MATIEIKHRFNGKVLFACEIVESVLRMRAALEKATASDTDLSGADLSGAKLSYADLSGAKLSGAKLSEVRGEKLNIATHEQAIENLDKVREIILDNNSLLSMGHWHGDKEWVNRTCAEEVVCGTTHCLAGWLQVCSTEPALKQIDAQLAGILSAPVAAKMFFRDTTEVLQWLREREYAK